MMKSMIFAALVSIAMDAIAVDAATLDRALGVVRSDWKADPAQNKTLN